MSNFQFTRPDNFPPVVKNLLIINVIIFLGQIILEQQQIQLMAYGGLVNWKMEEFMPFQFVTHMFMHGSLGHLFFNMFSLWMFGKILENYWGPKRFLLFYLLCGIAAAFAQQIMGDFVVAVGASGAIMGLFAAFAFLFPNTELYLMFVPIPVKAKWAVIGFAAIDLFSGVAKVSGDNVAHWAHLGGALAGIITVYLWNKTKRDTFY